MRLLLFIAFSLLLPHLAAAQVNPCVMSNTIAVIHPATETAYTLGIPDQCSLLVFKNTGAETVTLPQPGTAFFPPGFTFSVFAQGAGGITLTPVSGTQINGGSTLAKAQNVGADCFTDGTNWYCKP